MVGIRRKKQFDNPIFGKTSEKRKKNATEQKKNVPVNLCANVVLWIRDEF